MKRIHGPACVIFGGSELLPRKGPSDLSRQVQELVRIVTIDPAKAHVVGSITIPPISKFSSDLDVREKVVAVGCKTRAEACEWVAKQIQEVVKRVTESPHMWVAEVKVGHDTRFEFGQNLNISADATPAAIRKHLQKLLRNRVVTPAEYTELLQLVGKPEFAAAYREFYLIRWTAAEVVAGECERRGRTFKLPECVGEIGHCKLDTIAILGVRFVAVDTFWFNAWVSPDGREHWLNMPDGSMEEFLDTSLTKDIERLTSPDSPDYNPMKGAKRLFSQAAKEGDKATVQRLIPLLAGPYAALNRVRADLETLRLLVGVAEKLPAAEIARALDDIKVRVSDEVVEPPIDPDFAADMNLLVDNVGRLKRESIVATLSRWVDYFERRVSEHAEAYLRRRKFIGGGVVDAARYPGLAAMVGGAGLGEMIDRGRKFVGHLRDGRGDGPSKRLREWLDTTGSQPITAIEIARKPIRGLFEKAADFFSSGRYTEQKKKLGYDDMYHNFLLITIGGKVWKVEKNHQVEAKPASASDLAANRSNVDLGSAKEPPLTVKEMIEVASRNDPDFWIYRVANQNCQKFTKDMLSRNGLTPVHEPQNARALVETMPLGETMPNVLTDLAARIDAAVSGGAKNSWY